MTHNPTQPTPRPACDAGFVFALSIEADAFAAAATETTVYEASGLTFHEGIIAGRRVAWCVGGVGAAAATRATRLLIDGHRPLRIVTAGFAGGLVESLARGAIVYPAHVVCKGGGEPVAFTAGQGGLPRGDHTIVSAYNVVTTTTAKRDLAAATGASLVDMETFAVATVAYDAGLPCASIRVISDTAGQELPREIATLVQPQSGMRRLGSALAAMSRRPRAALDMWQLWEHAVVDGRTLAGALVEFCRTLPEPEAAVG